MATDPATQAVLDALVSSRVGEYATSGSDQFRRELAPLIVAAVRPILIRECAEAIRDHADKHAPAEGNYAQLRMRRHLLIAERVVGNLDPITPGEIVAALAGRYEESGQFDTDGYDSDPVHGEEHDG